MNIVSRRFYGCESSSDGMRVGDHGLGDGELAGKYGSGDSKCFGNYSLRDGELVVDHRVGKVHLLQTIVWVTVKLLTSAVMMIASFWPAASVALGTE